MLESMLPWNIISDRWWQFWFLFELNTWIIVQKKDHFPSRTFFQVNPLFTCINCLLVRDLVKQGGPFKTASVKYHLCIHNSIRSNVFPFGDRKPLQDFIKESNRIYLWWKELKKSRIARRRIWHGSLNKFY